MRLSRIEGQVRGLKKMIEADKYCPDIIYQTQAVRAALQSFSKELLSEHINTCVKEDIESGKSESSQELADLIIKVLK